MARATDDNGAVSRLKGEAGGLADALTQRAVGALRTKVEDAAGRLAAYVENGAGPGLTAAITGAKGMAEGKSPARSLLGAGFSGLKEKVSGVFGRKGKGGGRRKLKLTNIVESADVGVPARVAYNQWTEFSQFPTFTKKVESADRNQNEQQKVNWKAQVFWSHRTWEATIVDQRPDERIVWRSKGQKGHVDGAVTFHELAPNLTRILAVLEYHPQGLFERTGNIWRAQGRRARLELKHFQRHVMTNTILNPDDIEGWRGAIEDSKVVKDHETALKEEQERERGDREPGKPEAGQDPGDGDFRDGDSREEDSRDGDTNDGNTREEDSRDEDTSDGRSGARRASPRRQARQQTDKNTRSAQRPQAARRGTRGGEG
ncbi:MAG TPA: SRPBCC family protein [Trebonia sp.]|nr:SRPBCC family protein [Trebonia sp.]